MSGPIGLHGGGEYLAGDEPFLDALIEAAAISSRARVAARGAERDRVADGLADGPPSDVSGRLVAATATATNEPIRIVILPTAASRGLPDRAASTGRSAFERRASAAGRRAIVEVARIVDAASAADPLETERLAGADLIHLPGGDPDLVPAILRDSPALAGLDAAWQRGAAIAGASAGAMALADWTWTPGGGIRGLGLVRGLAVVPHYDDVRRTRWQQALDELAPGGIGYLGLDERTGILSTRNGAGEHAWRVAGPGAAYWFARGAAEPRIARHGDLLHLAP